MDDRTVREVELTPMSGFIMLVLLILNIVLVIVVLIVGLEAVITHKTYGDQLLTVAAVYCSVPVVCFAKLWSTGFKIVRPNEAIVFTLFGKYYGTLRKPGFYFVNPFTKQTIPRAHAADKTRGSSRIAAFNEATNGAISLKLQTWDNGVQKVNDALGNPLNVGVVVVWRVVDPTKAVFAVENFREFLHIQTDSVIRNTTRLYPYDNFNEHEDDHEVFEKTLRGSSQEIVQVMKTDLSERVAAAGLEIEEVRIAHIAYSEEIASIMLQRQQAAAIVAARRKIVDGAVGMVKLAIDKLADDGIVELSPERKAHMVTNLMVVLAGNRDDDQVINVSNVF